MVLMKRPLLYGLLREKQDEFCAVIGYPSGITRCVPQENYVPFPYTILKVIPLK